jgi:hypothetical protein
MRNQRPLSRVASLLILLGLCSLRSVGAAANPVYPDEDSISNGAQLYELYCSDCHGRDTTSVHSPLYESAADAADNYPELVDPEQQKESAGEGTDLPMATEKKAPWPEWADRPDPDADAPPDPKMEMAAELIALIDEAHGIKSGPESEQEPEQVPLASAAVGFEPVPGATNLADPSTYFYGTSEQEMFNSIANGTGTSMVGWRSELGDENAIWDLINYLRSFWGEEWQD